MSARRPPELPYDLTLRFWSDAAPLGPLVESLGLEIQHLHVAGEPMARTGRLSDRIAQRHYASVGHADVAEIADVRAWIADALERVKAATALADGLRGGAIEGTCWISLFGETPAPAPVLDPVEARDAADLNLAVLVENYADTDVENFPAQTWLAGGPRA